MKNFLIVVCGLVGLFVFYILVNGYFYKPTEKGSARHAIETCRENAEKDSKYDRSNYAIFMGACDNMAEEFERKYGTKP